MQKRSHQLFIIHQNASLMKTVELFVAIEEKIS